MRPGSPEDYSVGPGDERDSSVSSVMIAGREEHDEQPSHEDRGSQTDRERNRQLLSEGDENETHDTDTDTGTDRHDGSPRVLRSHRSGAPPGSGARGRLDRCPRKETGHDDAGFVQEIERDEDDHHVEGIGGRRYHRGENHENENGVFAPGSHF